MNEDNARVRLLTRRAMVLGGIQATVLGVLGSRLYYLQVLEADQYKTLAEENRISVKLIAPSRGRIVDRFGVPLAVNEQNFRVQLVPEQVKDVRAMLKRLSAIVPVTEEDEERILRDIRRHRRFVPVTVRENLSWDQVSAIELNAPDLPGIDIDVGEIRHYPLGFSTAHIIGYVGPVSEKELTGDPVLGLPDFRIGKAGIEKQHEDALRGTAGSRQLEVNAVNRVIRELARDDGQQGRQLTLTLDSGLQEYAQARVSAEPSAAAVVMDVHTGGIFALASNPGYDPNAFAFGIPSGMWKELNADPTTPLINKVTAGHYAPGSTFKMIVALAALEEGIVGVNHTAFCPGHMTLGNHRFHCWKKGGHGTVNVVGALEQSCDVFFYDLARRMGIDPIAAMANRFGLGLKTDIDLPGERAGVIPTRAWKKSALKQSWQQGESLIASIGQGFVLSTPLQLAVMTSRLVNGGYAVKPHLTKEIEGGMIERTSWPEVGVKPEHLELIVKSMNAVTMSQRGTAHKARITEPGLEMGGKTGTSQVRRITMAERAKRVLKNEELPWKYRDHALFVGYAPIHAPRFACAVLVEHGGGGSSVAAPMARDILLECQRRNPPPVPVAGTEEAGEKTAAAAVLNGVLAKSP